MRVSVPLLHFGQSGGLINRVIGGNLIRDCYWHQVTTLNLIINYIIVKKFT